ncbi:MAG TPA: tRNA dihydrouridine synthase DusB [Nitrospirae bacterium]|nr:tRNA-dihydrouridine synthase C [bacterium BMS3Bbin09]HDH34304.1 tRNA dihydrouridine synthase DusB [Nitrospirota bacterium]HDO66605.1 tRNA dihydrouridine synthase DusB [Nitrospirota bacterium]HEW80779.1 tRNA dihydrouridine synthase DusB [Nitrospirota bacterium]
MNIGNLKLDSPLILAPMAGISDLPYRIINRSMGCGFAFTEMLSSTALSYRSKGTMEKLTRHEKDRPLAIQIVGANLDIIKQAMEVLSEYPHDTIDLNAACPVTKVAGTGKGAGLLKEPLKMKKLLKMIVKNTNVPVTVKIRSGWDEASVNAVDVALHAEDSGVSAVIIHGRTRVQRYKGTVDYNIIREVKEAISIPVIASGDALRPDLIKKLFDETGCNGVAIARGALGNPWIFHQTIEYLKNGTEPSPPDIQERIRVMTEHLALMVECNGGKLGVLQFRKFFGWYTKGLPVKELKVRAFHACTHDEMQQMIDELEKTVKEIS